MKKTNIEEVYSVERSFASHSAFYYLVPGNSKCNSDKLLICNPEVVLDDYACMYIRLKRKPDGYFLTNVNYELCDGNNVKILSFESKEFNLVPLEIYCPFCGHRHIDRDEWSTEAKKHHKHLCTSDDGGCGKVFKVNDSDVYYIGA